jgi:hypothetical protein
VLTAWQDLNIPLPDKPVGDVANWMLYVAALAVIVMGMAMYKMYAKGITDMATLMIEIKQARQEANDQHEACRSKHEALLTQFVDVNRKLGAAEASLAAIEKTNVALLDQLKTARG